MNTTKNEKFTVNQNCFNYAVYMMLGSYFKKAEAASQYYIQKMYLYYTEQKKEKQYEFEDLVINFTENTLMRELPEDIWDEVMKVSFFKEEDRTCAVFAGRRYTVVVECNYRGKGTKLHCKVYETPLSIER